MQLEEKREMLELLESGRQALLRALEGLSEEAAVRCPAPQSWSVLECVEHVAVVEDYLYRQLVAAKAADARMVNEKREAAIRIRAADRTRQVPAPEGAKPSGRFASLAAALQCFLDSRARTVQFVESSSADLRREITSHPLIGTVNCYETLLMIAAHPNRHAAQIAEIRAEVE